MELYTYTIIEIALVVYISIQHLGLFPNTALKATLTLFVDVTQSWLWIGLFGHDRIEQSGSCFGLGLSASVESLSNDLVLTSTHALLPIGGAYS